MSDTDIAFISLSDLMEDLLTDKDRTKVEYWDALSDLILESMEMRAERELSQKDVAKKMNTKQSVISRFENMGRRPNYDFLVRYASAIGGSLGITFESDFNIKASQTQKVKVREISTQTNLSIQEILKTALKVGLEHIVRERRLNNLNPRAEEGVAESGWCVKCRDDTETQYLDFADYSQCKLHTQATTTESNKLPSCYSVTEGGDIHLLQKKPSQEYVAAEGM
ncbi:helix-turn-helix transcriptional regulator [Marispirochaeta sp.]|uniref:helix-turn-helix domain-containing protein n=1 Tax=Marispirochaeta sp. TaxID=2038653 RepID=UPI0029C94D66|nr:helix-turn-helix transcriptional regulator [Marispirochaeta sp.]